jgi:hypothetical protein
LVGLVLLWTVAFLVVLFFVGGDVAPCPELRPVGLPETDREAIAEMCRARDLAGADLIRANAPWSWVVIWAAGVGVIAAATNEVRRHRPAA